MDYVSLIKARLSISEVISTRIRLNNTANVMWALCPFHNEKTPSFKVDDKQESYYCFGCGKHGDMFSFIQEFDNCSFIVALEFLANMANVDINYDKNSNKNKYSELNIISAILKETNKFFTDELFRSNKALSYIRQRIENLGFDFKMVCKLYEIGFAPDNNVILNKLKETHAIGMIKKAGLLSRNGFALFKNRIIFPIKDNKANIVAFGGRLLPSGSNNSTSRDSKYLNSPETEIFHKSKVFYGFDQLLNMHKTFTYITEKNLYNFVVIVEGYIDTITLQMAGVKALGILGTSFTPSHINILKRFKKIILCFDGDNAGLNAFKRSIQTIYNNDVDFTSRVRIIFLPDGKDPYDMYIENKNLFSKLLKNPLDISDAIWEFYVKQRDIKARTSPFSPEEQIEFLSLIEKEFLSFINKKDNANAYFALKSFFGRRIFAAVKMLGKSKNKQIDLNDYNFDSSKNKEKDNLYKNMLLQLSVMYPEILLESNRDEKISEIQFHDKRNIIMLEFLISFINDVQSQNDCQNFILYIRQNIQNTQISSTNTETIKKFFAPLIKENCTEDTIIEIISDTTTESFLRYNNLTKEKAAKDFDKHYKSEMLHKKHEDLKQGNPDAEKISEFFDQIKNHP
ncbi:DNA primase [Anaplasmataceae bacterium AB001_6]|nr:DNA primase [Anaplasmataceae bacterium AB001_6]